MFKCLSLNGRSSTTPNLDCVLFVYTMDHGKEIVDSGVSVEGTSRLFPHEKLEDELELSDSEGSLEPTSLHHLSERDEEDEDGTLRRNPKKIMRRNVTKILRRNLKKTQRRIPKETTWSTVLNKHTKCSIFPMWIISQLVLVFIGNKFIKKKCPQHNVRFTA